MVESELVEKDVCVSFAEARTLPEDKLETMTKDREQWGRKTKKSKLVYPEIKYDI